MAGNKIGLVLALDGEKEFTNSLREIGAETKKVQTEIKALASEYEGNANSLEHLSKKQELLNRAQSASERSLEQAKNAAEKANRIYSEQGKHLEKLEAALEKAKKRQLEAANSVGKGSDEYKKYSKRVQDLEKAIDKQSSSHSKAAQQVTKWETEVVKAESALRKDNKAVQDNAKYLNEASNSADKCATSIDKMGKECKEAGEESKGLGERVKDALTVAAGNLAADAVRELGDAAKEAAKYVVDVGSSFEKAMSEVEAISGANASQLQAMEAAAKRLGSSSKFSASAVAESFKYMSLAGWETADMLEAIDGVVNLAAASEMELGEASDMVTDYLSAFGMEASEAAKMADMLAFAQANSNTTVRQLGDAYGNAAANMHAAGQDIETTTAILEAMANQGTKGAEAGTALSAMMRDIGQKATDGAIKIGKQSVAIQDANGNYRDMSDILADVEKATKGMGTAEKDAALRATFSSKSIKAVNEVLTEGIDKVNSYEDALRKSNGSAQDMAETMMDNLQGSLAEFNSAREGLGIALYDKVSGPLTSLVDIGTSALSGLTSVIEGTTSETEQMVNQLTSANDALKDSKANYEGLGDSTEAEAQRVDILVRELEALNAQESLTETQKARVKAIVQELSGVMPSLTDAYNDQTGKIDLENEALEKLAENAKNVMINNAVQEMEQAYVGALVQAEVALAAGERELEQLQKRKDFYENLGEAINGMNEMSEDWNQENYIASQIDLWNEALEAGVVTAEEYEEGMKHIATGSGSAVDATQWLADKMWDATGAVDAQSSAVEDLQETVDDCQTSLDDMTESTQKLYQEQEEAEGVLSGVSDTAEDLRGDLKALKDEQDGVTEVVDEATQAELQYNKILMEASLASKKHREELARQKEAAEIAEESAKNVRDAWNKTVEDTKNSLGKIDPTKIWDGGEVTTTWDLIGNLDSQIEGMQKYSQNLETLKDHVGKEISPEFMSYMEDMGTSGADFVNNIVLALESDGGPERVAEVCQKYAEATNFEDALAVQLARDKVALEHGLKDLGSTDQEFDALQNAIDKGLTGTDEAMQTKIETLIEQAKTIGAEIPKGLTESLNNGDDVSAEDVVSQLEGSLTGALEGWADIVEEQGGSIPEGLVASIEDGTADVEEAFKTLLSSLGDIDAEDLFTETSPVDGWVTSISDAADDAAEAAQTVTDSVAGTFEDAQEDFSTAGADAATNFATGISNGISEAVSAAESMVRSTMGSLESGTGGASNVGYNISAGVATGIRNGTSVVSDAAAQVIRTALDRMRREGQIHSPSRLFRDMVGIHISTGVAKGIDKGKIETAKAASDMMGNALAAAQKALKKKGKGSPEDLVDEWNKMLDKALKASKKKGKKETVGEFGLSWYTTDAKGKKHKKDAETYYGEVYQVAESYFDNMSTLQEISDKDEKEYWEKVQKHLKRGSQAWFDAQKKINSATQRIIEAEQEAAKEAAEAAAEAAEAAAKIGNFDALSAGLSSYMELYDVSLKEEKDYWEQAVKTYKDGTDDKIAAERELYKATKSYNEKLAEINQNFADAETAANEQRIQSIKDLTKEIANAYGLFDEFVSESATGKELLFNMKTQAEGYDFWAQQLAELSGKGILSEELMQELTDMGASQTAAIVALNSLTEDELKEFQQAYDKKMDIANKMAEKDVSIQQEFKEAMAAAEKTKAEELSKLNSDSGKIPSLLTEMKKVTSDSADRIVAAINNTKSSGGSASTSSSVSSSPSTSSSAGYSSSVSSTAATVKAVNAQDTEAKLRDNVLKALDSEPQRSRKVTADEAKKHVPLWVYLVQNYGVAGHKSLYKKLAKALGLSVSDDPTASDKNKILQLLKAHGLRKGTKRLDDIFAWMDEEGIGSEMIIRKSDGARLNTNVRRGDAIIPAANTDNLWDWSQIVPTDMLNAIAAQNAVTQAYVSQLAGVANTGALNDSLGGGSSASNATLLQMANLMSEFLPYLAEKTNISIDGDRMVDYTSRGLASRQRRYARR